MIPHNFNRTESHGAPSLEAVELADLASRYPEKLVAFAQHGYRPHYWQLLFHTLTNPETGRLCRFRHLVAGRRGGKTFSAAFETIYYALNPTVFHKDVHGKEAHRPLVIWVLVPDYPTGLWSKLAIREALAQFGAVEGVDYKENRGNQWIEFENGSFLVYKSADNPQKLRGAGVDIMWMDEAAVNRDDEAYEVASPSLTQTLGIFLATTTPQGKNWLYDRFWSEKSKASPYVGRVEYWSIDSPYYDADEWMRVRDETHPMIFAQEYMASFDAMAGKELSGEWLNYYDENELAQIRNPDGSWAVNVYIAVDPAASLADTADKFAIAAVGVKKDRSQAYLLDLWSGRLPFPEQIDKINQFYHKHSAQYISIEKNAYQAVLAQQVMRLEGLPPVAAVFTRGKKSERILAMAPFFRTGRIRIRKDQTDFISEWVDYDSKLKNPKDDCLDAVEMALRAAGVVLPIQQKANESPVMVGAATTASDWSEIAAKTRPGVRDSWDYEMGEDW